MFGDIKNQVIVEAGEKREASGSPKSKQPGSSKKRAAIPKNSKVDRGLARRDLKVPVLRSSASMMANSALFGGAESRYYNQQLAKNLLATGSGTVRDCVEAINLQALNSGVEISTEHRLLRIMNALSQTQDED